ncbi:MAG: ABC transporter ATP-binding protein [Deltaproteobacteria bacterium]|nr:ABC transporter ATP-binding protein [Deltaproteobacteria bacterium]
MLALIATQALTLWIPRLLREATDALVARDRDAVLEAALLMVSAAILGAGVRIASRLLIFNSGRRAEFEIRNDLFSAISAQSPAWLSKMSTADLMSRSINDLQQVRLLLGPGILNVVNSAVVFVVVIPTLFLTDPTVATACLAPFPGLILIARVFGKQLYALSRRTQEALASVSARVQESVGAVMTVRAYRLESSEQQVFDERSQALVDANLDFARLRSFMFPMMALAGAIGTAVLLYLGGISVLNGTMSVGQLVELNAYLGILSWPTAALGWMMALWQRGLASMDRIDEILRANAPITSGSERLGDMSGRIEVRSLSIDYETKHGKVRALDDVSLTIEPGETVVIVGRSGSGKSTLVKAISRLLEVPKSAVYVDGRDVTDLSIADVRGGIGYAPQEAFLFSKSISENVSFFGEYDATKVGEAVRAAGLESDLAGFSQGLETIVGERGVTLSGGQRQRVALARALIKRPRILVLDDTLSAVDTDTETRILAELEKRENGRTTILVSHRLTCARAADRIFVLDHGRLVEQGSEDELLAKNGVYAEMYRRQRLREELGDPSSRVEAEVRS